MDTKQPDTQLTEAPSRRRQIAFRIVSWLTALWLLAVGIFGLTEIVLMWLPVDVIAGVVGDDAAGLTDAELAAEIASFEMHRSHYLMIGIITWAIVLGAFAQLRKPERRVAPMLQLLAAIVGGTIVYGLSGTVSEWFLEEWTLLVPVLAVAALHPRVRELFSRPTFDRPMLGVALAGTVPWAVYAFTNAGLQVTSGPGDPHWVEEHWAKAALLGIVVVSFSFIGASDKSSWQLPAWIAAVASAMFGLHSLVFPGAASGLTTPWAAAAIGWGVAYAIVIVLRGRRRGAAVAN